MSRPVLLLAIGLCTSIGFAQTIEPVEPPSGARNSVGQTPPPTSAPAAADPAGDPDRQLIKARVIELTGDVKYAPLGSRAWKPLALDDELPEGTQIITGVRSAVKLQIGDQEPYSCLLIESVGLTVLNEAAIAAGVKRVQIGVGYGRVRAGVAEGGLQSDFTVHSPVATLSKRGTWNFTLYYERDTDIFEIGLLDRGLVQALSRVSGQSRSVRPGEYVTQAMRAWLDEAQIARNVAIPDILGQGEIDIAFNRLRDDGLGVLDPGSGRRVLINLVSPQARAFFAQRLRETLGGEVLPPITPGRQLRPEGFFGTGRGDQLIDVVISASDSLVQKGNARPGTYRFRKSALQGWMQRNARP